MRRKSGECNPLLRGSSEHGVDLVQRPQQEVKFLFDSEDLLQTGLSIRNFNCRTGHSEQYAGLMTLNLDVASIDEICSRYAELLSGSIPQLGLDEDTTQFGSKLSVLRHEEADAILGSGSMLSARHFMRRGVPPSARCGVWRVALGLADAPTAAEHHTLEVLRAEVDRLDLVTDELFLHDIHLVTDDPRFFVFEVSRSASWSSPCANCFSPPGGAERCHFRVFQGHLGPQLGVP